LKIAAIGKALPPHYYDQEALLLALKHRWSPRLFNAERLERLHKNVLVGGRHLALPIEEYETLSTWGRANDAWIRVAQEVGAAAVEDALGQAGLSAADIDALIFVTVTGVATPSIDARLMNRLRLPPRVRRISSVSAAPPGLPVWGAPPTTCAPIPTRWRSCSRSSSAR